MENSPFSHNSGDTSPNNFEGKDEDKDSKKSKSKSKKAEGLFDKVTEKYSEKTDKDLDKSFDLGSFMLGKTEATKSESEDPDNAAESDANQYIEIEPNTPEITDAESLEAAQQMAVERRNELDSESDALGASEAETEAAKQYYDKILQDNELPIAAAESVIDDIENNENREVDAADDLGSEDEAVPVVVPTAHAAPTLPNRPPRSFGPAMGPNGSPNVAPATTRTEYIPYIDRSRAFGDMLVGGVIGYLVGRRRGRIKTERKLLPVQRKLEAEVGALKKQVIDGEYAVRAAVKRASEARLAANFNKLTSVPYGVLETSSSNSRERQLKAPELHTRVPSVPPERIGKVLVLAEALPHHSTEELRPNVAIEQSNTLNRPMQISVEKQVEVMSRNELLSLSEKIIVEGSTLRQVYETHLVSERGLRRLVAEHLRGGNVLRVFKREVIEHDIDFERDPKLRDAIRSRTASAGSKADTDYTNADSPLQQLLAKAGFSERDEPENNMASNDKFKKTKPAFTTVDISMAAVIAILIALIALIIVSK